MADDLGNPSSGVSEVSIVSSSSHKLSVHRFLGGGIVADVLLWKRRNVGGLLLVMASTFWYLFEIAGYSPITLMSNVFLLLSTILFFWAKSASLLNRPLPPLPNLEISEKFAEKIAQFAEPWINHVLAIARDIALERNVKLFLQVVLLLWVVSVVGGLFNFITLLYIGIIISLSVPVLYDKYQNLIDEKLYVAKESLLVQYKKIDEKFLSKIPMSHSKEKKTQ